MAVREEHLKFAAELFKNGKWLFASALLDESGKMNGSVIACQYDSEEDLKKEYLEKEIYVTAKVWEKIEIKRASFSPHNLKYWLSY